MQEPHTQMPEPHTGYLIKQIADKLRAQADADLAQHHLTMAQSRVLSYLSRSGGTAAQKDIGEFLGVAHPTTVGVIARLEQNGFVTCAQSAADKRNKQVRLTARARSIVQAISQTIEQTEARMLRSLSPGEIAALRRMLHTIHQNLEH